MSTSTPAPGPAPKRRRLNTTTTSSATAATLAKPFKSPIKRSAAAATHPPPQTHHQSQQRQAAPSTPRNQAAQILALKSDIDTLGLAARILRESGRGAVAYSAAAPADGDASVDSAVGVEPDARLGALIAKWRGVSRDAAEVVFGVMKERVEGMGGVGAMRARERERWMQREREFELERGLQRDMDEAEGTEGGRRREGGDEGNEMEGEGGDNGVSAENEAVQEFTMDIMLQSLGVDLEGIGFDAKEQRWID